MRARGPFPPLWREAPTARRELLDAVAAVARARRHALLRVHRNRLPYLDLEDCYSQATLELLLGVRRGRTFATYEHIANALDQKLESRIIDRHRALRRRTRVEAAFASSLPLGFRDGAGVDVVDVRTDLEALVDMRARLRATVVVAPSLTYDQRLVLRSQVSGEVTPRAFCEREGWSLEKYRKVAQRGRTRLRALVERPAAARTSEEQSETRL